MAKTNMTMGMTTIIRADTEMRKPKVLNPPERIYLQVGEIVEFRAIAHNCEASWCDSKVYDSDIEYRLVKRKAKKKWK